MNIINMSINYISLKDSDEFRIMYRNSDNLDIMTGADTNDIIEELFDSTLKRYKTGLEESMGVGE